MKPNLNYFVVPLFDKDDQCKWCKTCTYKKGYKSSNGDWCYMFTDIVVRCAQYQLFEEREGAVKWQAVMIAA